MNIGGIKSFLGGQDAVKSQVTTDNQLRESGLRQPNNISQGAVGALSSRYSVAYTALSLSFSVNLKVDGQSPDKPAAPKEPSENQAIGFDYEQIADNVMKFVGKVIRGAVSAGESDEKVASLFAQAREGVSQGIKSARGDLTSVMNDELSTGIDNVEKTLGERIDRLEQDIFSPETATSINAGSIAALNRTELSIQTRDGDTLTLSFDRSESLSFAQQSSTQQQTDAEGNDSELVSTNSYVSFMQQLGVSLSVEGELDEDELKAVADLVNQIAEVADEFFNGDVSAAFENAASLGYDDEEIVSFSAQITKQRSVSALAAYENVQSYTEETKPAIPESSAQSINQYVEKMLSAMDLVSNTLNDKEDYNSIVSGILNYMDEEVKIPDLLSAINRFYQFNQRIVDSLNTKVEE